MAAAPAGPSPAEEAAARRAAAEGRRERARAAQADALGVETACLAEVDRLTGEIATLREQLATANLAARAARQSRLEADKELASAERRLRNAVT
jgi:hypothetical protein